MSTLEDLAKLPMHSAIKPEMTREAALLALKLINWKFGELPHAVVKTLNKHGRLNLKEVIEQVQVLLETERKLGDMEPEAVVLSETNISAAVMTLVRQGCVVVNEWQVPTVQGRPGRVETLFELDMARMLNLLRVPLFLRVMETAVPRKRLREAKVVVGVLVCQGRLMLDELVEKSMEALKAEWEAQRSGYPTAVGEEESDDQSEEEEDAEGGRRAPKASGEEQQKSTKSAQTGMEVDSDGDGERGGDQHHEDHDSEDDDETDKIKRRFARALALSNTDNKVTTVTDDSVLKKMDDHEMREHFRDVVNDLINRQLVEKSPSCRLCPPEDRVHQNAQKKGKGNLKEPEGEEEVKENEIKVHGAAVREFHSTNRFVREDTWRNESRKAHYSIEEGSNSYHVQTHAVRVQDDPAVAIPALEETWRLNYQELNRRVYNGIAVETVKTGLECIEGLDADTCGRVIEAMLYANANPKPANSPFDRVIPLISVSNPMTIAQIVKASGEIHDSDSRLKKEDIEEVFGLMLRDSAAEDRELADANAGIEGFDPDFHPNIAERKSATVSNRGSKRKAALDASERIAASTASDPTLHPAGFHLLSRKLPSLSSCLKSEDCGPKAAQRYLFHTPTALKIARTAKLLAIIEKRFGPNAMRIWKMLYDEGQMEQKAISQDSMLGNTRPREILYAMLRNGFLSLQDIPKNADRAPSKTIYTWRATMPASIITASTMLYKAASNMIQVLTDVMNDPIYRETLKRHAQHMEVDIDIIQNTNWRKYTIVDQLFELDQELALFQFEEALGWEDWSDEVEVDNAKPKGKARRKN